MTSLNDLTPADRAALRSQYGAFDPDVIDVPVYDDRAPRIVKVIDPVVQARNKGNRQRGKRAERVWRDLINEMCKRSILEQVGKVRFMSDVTRPLAETRGILGGADVTWGIFAFEVKHRHMGWPSNTVIKNALVQAQNNAGTRTPVVVACMTTHNSRSWRVYTAVKEYEDGRDWLRKVLA